ncbi:heat shock protein, Hsp20 family protein [Enhygromyxa salina]|uniref:Heat shock protein, Hsp20 family protein n=2 Tax=Enhygromyxa salina TaxID=215803 RepID=A0A0C2DF67_9BACT|nr:heat shock protein, Hsp20 family protein [Enhygromyxa salina]
MPAKQTQAQVQTQAQAQTKTVVHPLVDVLENEREFLLLADLPGVNRDALDITVNGGQLEIHAESDTLEYRRNFALGDDVDLDAVEARLEYGELEIHLPKRAEAQARKIAIQS